MSNDLSIYEVEMAALEEATRRLCSDSRATAVFLIDADGRQLAAAGDCYAYDSTSLAALMGDEVQMIDVLAKLMGENEYSVLFQEYLQREHIHLSIVANRALLVLIFADRTSLGLVRLRTKAALGEFEKVFDAFPGDPFVEITDDHIEALLSK